MHAKESITKESSREIQKPNNTISIVHVIRLCAARYALKRPKVDVRAPRGEVHNGGPRRRRWLAVRRTCTRVSLIMNGGVRTCGVSLIHGARAREAVDSPQVRLKAHQRRAAELPRRNGASSEARFKLKSTVILFTISKFEKLDAFQVRVERAPPYHGACLMSPRCRAPPSCRGAG